ncbi:hypothetical protein [Streptomyces flavofungini]|uniref:hypothetical protein n=1 Tax=Streptomyces flavofungini TaxID=68200 RepID=UPI0034DE9E93
MAWGVGEIGGHGVGGHVAQPRLNAQGVLRPATAANLQAGAEQSPSQPVLFRDARGDQV